MFLSGKLPRRTTLCSRRRTLRGLGDDDFGFVDSSAEVTADPLAVAVDAATSSSDITVADTQDFGGSVLDAGGAMSPSSITQSPSSAPVSVQAPSATSDSTLWDSFTKIFSKGADVAIAYANRGRPLPVAPRPAVMTPARTSLLSSQTVSQAAPLVIGGGILIAVLSALSRRKG
jgi:hypothetical protein